MLSYRRDRAAKCVIVFTKSRRLELGDNILRTLQLYLQPLWLIGLKICRIQWKTQNKRDNGVQGHSRLSRSVPMESPCAISYYKNWHSISYRFGVIAAYRSNFKHFAFFEPPFGGLRGNVRCSSWAHWKARSGLPISVSWSFFATCYGWVATSEKRSKIGDFAPTRSFWFKISGTRCRPHYSFLHG